MKPLLFTLVAAPLALAQSVYVIDTAHSSAQFSVRHMMVANTRGEFPKVEGTFAWDRNNLAAARVEASIDVASVNTREAKRDDHLRSADFFDAAKYPKMLFKSKSVFRQEGKLKLKGDLTIRGVTKEVVLDVEGPTPEVKDPWGKTRIGASATTTINRKDFGILYNKALDTGGVLVGDEVKITLDIEAVRQDTKKTTD